MRAAIYQIGRAMIPAVILVALLAGCVDIEEDLSLNKDGSGSYHIKYSMAAESINRMQWVLDTAQQLNNAKTRLATADHKIDTKPLLFSKELITKDIALLRPHGVVLANLKTEDTKGVSHVDLTLKFDTLAALTKTRFFANRHLTLTKDQDQRYSLVITMPGSGDPSDMHAHPQDADKDVSPILAGFRVVTTVHVPGRVLTDTASISGMRSATWEFEYDRDRLALVRLQNTVMRVTFDGQGASLPELKAPTGSSDKD